MASPVEDSARINDHARRVHFTSDHALGFNLHAASGKYHTVKSAGDDNAIAFNLSFDSSPFAQDNGLLGYDVSLDLAIDSKRPFELERALERHSSVDETGPLFAAAIIRGSGPLPSHDNPHPTLLL